MCTFAINLPKHNYQNTKTQQSRRIWKQIWQNKKKTNFLVPSKSRPFLVALTFFTGGRIQSPLLPRHAVGPLHVPGLHFLCFQTVPRFRSDPIQNKTKKKRAVRVVRQYSLVDSKRERRKGEKAERERESGKIESFSRSRGFREGSEERGCESSSHPVASKKVCPLWRLVNSECGEKEEVDYSYTALRLCVLELNITSLLRKHTV